MSSKICNKPCSQCIHSIQYYEPNAGLRCRKFKRIETPIARYDGYDLCGKEGRYFKLKLDYAAFGKDKEDE